MGYSDDNIGKLCKEYLAKGFTAFKLKVGRNLDEDRKRCGLIRDAIGYTNKLVNGQYTRFRILMVMFTMFVSFSFLDDRC